MNQLNYWQQIFEEYHSKNPSTDGSHNVGHLRRVWKNAQSIMEENADQLTIMAACYFHDLINYPKNHPKRDKSSFESALKSEEILISLHFPNEKIANVKHCIEAHSYSANITPITIEAKILQDADRIEALGAIGLARTFYVAGLMKSQLFCESDPLGLNRSLDDKLFALDHFKVKLLKLPSSMQTSKGKTLAQNRAEILNSFTSSLLDEI